MRVDKKALSKALCLLGKLKGADSVRLSEVGGELQLHAHHEQTFDAHHEQTFVAVRIAGSGDLGGSVEVSRKALAKVVGALAGSFDLTAHADRLDLAAGQRQFKLDLSSMMPSLPEPRSRSLVMAWESTQFLAALRFVDPAVGRDITRTTLSHFGLIPELGLAASDGHRLHVARICTFPVAVQFPEHHGPILLKALAEAEKNASIQLELASPSEPDRGPHWHWRVGNHVDLYGYGKSDADVTGADLERMFRAVLRVEEKLSVTRGATEVREAFELAAKVVDPDKGIKLTFGRESLLVSSGEGFSESIDISGPKTPRELFIDPRYAAAAIPVTEEWVQIQTGKDLDPVVFTSPETTAVVMPRRDF